MKHSNIYEKCHSFFAGYNEYYFCGVETFCEIIHTYPSFVIIRRYEA